ncbi:MAG: metal ABC transporter permease [Verrucomicrobia bacterium]|nr:metal ABC transporter permease [Verrucomicrobiota bacterium]
MTTVCWLGFAVDARGAEPGLEASVSRQGGGLTDRSNAWPTAAQWRRVVLLEDYNTRVVVGGTLLLGVAAGVIGSFTLLRKRALMGDALSHAMLPGIGLTFMLSVAAGGTGKSLWLLLLGATVSGLLGLGVILLVRNLTRLKEDAALGIVLSVFFGAGVAILGVVQRMGQGHSAGLESFIYGKTASMIASDAVRIAVVAALVLVVCTAFFKEFKLLCFDADYAASQGWPTVVLDVVMMGLVVMVTVIGLQAVGLILIIALLIIPPAAARFWTERLGMMALLAAVMGAAACAVGAAASALFPNLPSGAMIVLVGAALFLLSLLFGVRRGIVIRWLRRRELSRKVRQQHLLRAAYELREDDAVVPNLETALASKPIPTRELLRMRSWSPRELRRELRRAARAGHVVVDASDRVCLTADGYALAARVVRNHRLWELYLITHADIAPSHVDRDADAIEHVLGAGMIHTLELLLAEDRAPAAVPASPHLIGGAPIPQPK